MHIYNQEQIMKKIIIKREGEIEAERGKKRGGVFGESKQ